MLFSVPGVALAASFLSLAPTSPSPVPAATRSLDQSLLDQWGTIISGAAGLYRFPVRVSSSGGEIQESDVVGTSQSFAAAGRINVGSAWYFQGWFRDPQGPCGNGSNTTDGLQITFMP